MSSGKKKLTLTACTKMRMNLKAEAAAKECFLKLAVPSV